MSALSSAVPTLFAPPLAWEFTWRAAELDLSAVRVVSVMRSATQRALQLSLDGVPLGAFVTDMASDGCVWARCAAGCWCAEVPICLQCDAYAVVLHAGPDRQHTLLVELSNTVERFLRTLPLPTAWQDFTAEYTGPWFTVSRCNTRIARWFGVCKDVSVWRVNHDGEAPVTICMDRYVTQLCFSYDGTVLRVLSRGEVVDCHLLDDGSFRRVRTDAVEGTWSFVPTPLGFEDSLIQGKDGHNVFIQYERQRSDIPAQLLPRVRMMPLFVDCTCIVATENGAMYYLVDGVVWRDQQVVPAMAGCLALASSDDCVYAFMHGNASECAYIDVYATL